MSNFTITGSITIGGTYNGLTITNGSISGATFTATTVNATTVNATTFAGGAFTGTTFNGVTLDNTAWSTYTPTITAGSGTITSKSATGRYKQIGKTVFVQLSITITTNGSGASFVIATTPVTGAAFTYVIAGRESNVTGNLLQGVVTGGTMGVLTYNNLYPAADGYLLNLSGVYEAA